MTGAVSEFFLSLSEELKVTDKVKALEVLIPVLKEQEKEYEKREKRKMKVLLTRGYHFGAKNFEGNDILKNAIRVIHADYEAGVSVKETIPVPEGWFIAETLFSSLRKDEEVCIKSGGVIMLKAGNLFRVSCGSLYFDIPREERIKMAHAIDRGLYYRNDDLGVLIRSDGNVYLFVNGENRVYLKEPYKFFIFLRIADE